MLPAPAVAAGPIRSFPDPVLYALLAVVLLSISAVVMYVAARIGYRVLRVAIQPVRRVLRFVLPEGAANLVAAVLVVTALLGGMSAVLLTRDTSLGEGEGASEQVGEYVDRGLQNDSIWLRNDVYRPSEGMALPPYQRPTPDADGDRLKDAWERRGQTPAGVPLPGADPRHKDLYVVVRYGDRFQPLTPAEKQSLVDIWARMPVTNPDGETGIRLHIVDSSPYGGVQNRTITYTGSEEAPFGRYGALDARRCRYHLVTFAAVKAGRTVGIAGTPGYTALVQGTRNASYRGNVTRRVHVMTHELLHNVVGTFNGGQHHSSGGWLAPKARAKNNYLSSAATTHLSEHGLQGSAYYQHRVCGDSTPTTSSPS